MLFIGKMKKYGKRNVYIFLHFYLFCLLFLCFNFAGAMHSAHVLFLFFLLSRYTQNRQSANGREIKGK